MNASIFYIHFWKRLVGVPTTLNFNMLHWKDSLPDPSHRVPLAVYQSIIIFRIKIANFTTFQSSIISFLVSQSLLERRWLLIGARGINCPENRFFLWIDLLIAGFWLHKVTCSWAHNWKNRCWYQLQCLVANARRNVRGCHQHFIALPTRS